MLPLINFSLHFFNKDPNSDFFSFLLIVSYTNIQLLIAYES